MRKGSKVVLMFMSAGMLVAGAVLGTLAYLTDNDAVTNTFTVGNVQIELDEADVKTDGSYETTHDSRVKENKYHLIPGHTYIKDPTVTVKKGSENSYVRMMVTINEQADLDVIFAPAGLSLTEFFGGISKDWNLVNEKEDEAADTRTYEFRYKGTVSAPDDDVVLDDLFESITVPGSITNSDLEKIQGLEINVTADAIQADGFNTENDAWAAFDGAN